MKALEEEEAKLKNEFDQIAAKRDATQEKVQAIKQEIKRTRGKYNKSVKEYGTEQEFEEGIPDYVP